MTKQLRARALLVSAPLLCLGGAAQAQSVDYGGLEQLFGEPITTSVTGKPQKASDVAADLVILTQDDIRRSGADNIPDILRFVTGIDVRSYGLLDSNVGIRGYNQPANPRLLVLVNGRQVYLDDYGYVAWSTLPVQLDEIRQIEVVKGPNSALYGFNAASGVINIITVDPLRDNVNAVTVRTGNLGLAEASVVGTAHISDDAGIRLSASGFKANDYASQASSDGVPRLVPRIGAFNVEGSWMVSPNVQVTAEGGDVDSMTGVFNPAGSMLGARYRINSLRLGVSADTPIGLLAFDFSRNEARNSYLVPRIDEGDLVNTVYVAKVSNLTKLDASNTIRVGLEYRNNSAVGPVGFGGTIGYQVYSADAMWDWQMLPSLSLVNAVRIDHLSLGLAGTAAVGTGLTTEQYNHSSFTEPSFNSGLVWKVTDDDTLRLTAARGLQVPSLVDYAFQTAVPGYGAVLYGNPTLAPTAVWNYELGYDRAVPLIGSTLRAAAFFQRNVNLLAGSFQIQFGSEPGKGAASQSANIGSSHEVGIELGIRGKAASGWRWNASYSFASITDDIVPGLINPGLDYRHGTPQHTVILGGGYSLDRWELDAQGRWQSNFQDFRANAAADAFQAIQVDNYVSFSARIGFRVTDFLTLSGTAEQFDVLGLSASGGPLIERRFIAAATAHF